MRPLNPIELEDPSVPLPRSVKWSPAVQAKIVAYFAVCMILLSTVPNQIWDPESNEVVYIIGILGIWRYLWWANHFARAKIFEKLTYPKMRDRAPLTGGFVWRKRRGGLVTSSQ